jgi:hypothetical protein
MKSVMTYVVHLALAAAVAIACSAEVYATNTGAFSGKVETVALASQPFARAIVEVDGY